MWSMSRYKMYILITVLVNSFIECDAGTFGKECKSYCSSNCINGACNHVNGKCSGGCKPGYREDKCDKSKHSYCFQIIYG